MSVKVATGFACGYCGKVFDQASKADVCRDGHDLIYIPLSSTDLNNLLHFIQTKDEQFLTPRLMDTLQRYLRGN
jgi:hypothetical protein